MEDEELESGKRKRRERYVRKACAECKRRKIKCDGELPCLHCQTVCSPCEYHEGKARGGARRPLKTSEPPEEFNDEVLARLYAVEARLDTFAAQYPLSRHSPGDSASSKAQSVKNGGFLKPSLPYNGGNAQSAYCNTTDSRSSGQSGASGSRAEAEAQNPSAVYYEQPSAGSLSNLRDHLHSYTSGSPSNGAEPLPSRPELQTTHASLNQAALPQFVLPSKARTFAILHDMFDDLVSMYPLLHSPTIYKRYDSLWDHNGVYLPSVAQTFRKSELGLLLSCLASCSNMTIVRIGQVDGKEASREIQQWYKAAKSLVYDCALDDTYSTDLESIQAQIMLTLYYLHAENENAAYKLIGMAIRSAYEIGLHLAVRERGLDRGVIELRRRTWWCLYLVDRRTSMQLGRPFTVQDHDSDVQYPTTLDDLYEFPHQLDAPNRLEMSKIPYLMQFVGFSSICGEIYSKLYGVKSRWPPDERSVMDLDGKLEQWRFALPAFLRFDQANINVLPKWLAKQQLFLHLRGAHARLLLLRPFVSDPEAIAASHPAMAESALRLSSDIIHTIAIVKRTSDLVERLWYPSKQIILTCIGMIFWVVLNFPTKFSASSSKADLRVALQLLKDFSERSTSPQSKSSLRDIQFLRYLCNQALRARNQRPLESSADSPFHEAAAAAYGQGTSAAPGMGGEYAPPLYNGRSGDLAFLGEQDLVQDNLLLGLLDSGDAGILPTSEQFLMMGEDYSKQTMLSL